MLVVRTLGPRRATRAYDGRDGSLDRRGPVGRSLQLTAPPGAVSLESGMHDRSLGASELQNLADRLNPVWARLADPSSAGHYSGCRAAAPGPACTEACREVRAAQEELARLLREHKAWIRRLEAHPRWAKAWALVQETRTLLLASTPAGVQTTTTPLAHVLEMWSRTHALFEAVVILVERGFPQEAVILDRALFEVSLRLQELEAAAPDVRLALIFGWVNEGLRESEQLIGEAVRRGLEADPEPIRRLLAERAATIRRYQQDQGIKKLKRFLRPKQAAERFGRAAALFDFELASNVVHGSGPGHAFRTSQRPDGTVEILLRILDPEVLGPTAASAAESVLIARRAMVAVAGWPRPEALDDLLGGVRAV